MSPIDLIVRNCIEFFQGKGRAFSSGGDVTACIQSIHNGNYSFNYIIFKSDFFTYLVLTRLPDIIPMLHVPYGCNFVPHV